MIQAPPIHPTDLLDNTIRDDERRTTYHIWTPLTLTRVEKIHYVKIYRALHPDGVRSRKEPSPEPKEVHITPQFLFSEVLDVKF